MKNLKPKTYFMYALMIGGFSSCNHKSIGLSNPVDAGKIEYKTDSNIKTGWLLNTSSDTITFVVEHTETMGEMPVGNKEEIKLAPQEEVVLGLHGDFGFDDVVGFEKLPYAISLPSMEQQEYASCLQYHALTGHSEDVKNSDFRVISASISQ